MQPDWQAIRQDGIRQLDHWLKLLQSGEVSSAEIHLHPYRRDERWVSSGGHLEPEKLTRLEMVK